MSIAFLGLGRMGRELVGHLIAAGHDVTVWNRTVAVAEPYAEADATVALSPGAAVGDAAIVLTCFFGPDAVQEVVLDADLPIPAGALWIDITTVGPVVAEASARWADARRVAYVHSPVLGSLGPARNKDLGVLIGGSSAERRKEARSVVSVWADPERIIEYDSPAKAAVGKLVVNYSLAVGMQGLIEALRVAEAGGLTQAEGLQLAGLPKTPFSIIAAMKGPAVRDRSYEATQFSTNLLAKDVNLMLSLAEGQALPALTAAFASLEHARRAGYGEADFSSMAGETV
jgi:3-hydroxyisobutyrate dehydrogenase